jgi:hypothetical protein
MNLLRNGFLILTLAVFSLNAQGANKVDVAKAKAEAAKKAADDAAKRAEEAKKAAEAAKKAAEERAKKEKEDKEKEKDKDKDKDKDKGKDRQAAYAKALAEATAEDRLNSSQRFDVEFDFASFRQIGRSDHLQKDKSGKVAPIYEGVDLFASGLKSSYKSEGMEAIEHEAKYFNAHLRSGMKPDGLKALHNCEAVAIKALESNAKVVLVAKNVPRHSLFVTEREMLLHYGYEKFMARLMKDKSKKVSLKKFLDEIDDLMAPRAAIILNSDNIQLSCEIKQ